MELLHLDGEDGYIVCEGDANFFNEKTFLSDIVFLPEDAVGCEDGVAVFNYPASLGLNKVIVHINL